MTPSHLFRCLGLLLTLTLGGCSTGPYLKPEAANGTYNTENPTCPGPQQVIEFRPADETWIVFRVLAKLPNPYSPEGTKLTAYFRFIYLLPEPPRTSWSLFPSEAEKEEKKNLLERRKHQRLEITASSPFATIVLPDGTRTQVALPFLEKPYNHSEDPRAHGIWGPQVVISPKMLDNFTVIFPDIFLNGKKLDIPPVKFGISKDVYAPVLNC